MNNLVLKKEVSMTTKIKSYKPAFTVKASYDGKISEEITPSSMDTLENEEEAYLDTEFIKGKLDKIGVSLDLNEIEIYEVLANGNLVITMKDGTVNKYILNTDGSLNCFIHSEYTDDGKLKVENYYDGKTNILYEEYL